MLLLASAVGAACTLTVAIASVVTQVRRRGANPADDAPPEAGPALADSSPIRQTRATRQPFRAQLLYILVLALAAVGTYLWKRPSGQTRYSRTCIEPPTAAERLKLFTLRGFHYKINTRSHEAQSLFDQGVLLAWNFNQVEAEAAFRMAADADPNASMPLWGVQYAVGPGANRAVLPERPLYPAFAPDNFGTVREAARGASRLAAVAAAANPASAAAARDLAYAEAALLRWPEGSALGPRRDAAELAYSRALRKIGEAGKDAAALAMAAEALMNLHPWDYYAPNGGLKKTSEEAQGLIDRAIELDPKNALALHLVIHLSEAADPRRQAKYNSSRGLVAADRLLHDNGPWKDQQGHLLHMPSHTYIRTGRYNDAVLANINAYNANLRFAQHCLFPYEPEHNTDMLIFAASMAGKASVAEDFALRIRGYGQTMFLQPPAGESQNWAKLPLLLAHFARWKEVMALPRPGPSDRANCPGGGPEFAQVVWRYVRLLAAAARADGASRAGEAAEFQKLDGFLDAYLRPLREAEARVQPEAPTSPPAVYLCEHKGLAKIFVLIAEARVAFLRNETDEAVRKLGAAVVIEDGFAYMEPPRVYQPVRQCLGYVLAQAGKVDEAVKVYREDLEIFPDNGWSLHGMSAALHAAGRNAELDALQPALEAAWRHADFAVDSSCLAFSRPWGSPLPAKR